MILYKKRVCSPKLRWLVKELDDILRLEEILRRQQSHITWLKEGDNNYVARTRVSDTTQTRTWDMAKSKKKDTVT